MIKQIVRIRTSRKKYIFTYIIFFVSLFSLWFVKSLFTTIFFILSLFLVIDVELEILFRFFEINKKEVKEIKGIFTKKIISIKKNLITHVELNQSVMDRLLNIGDIIVHSQTSKIELKGIRNPHKILRIIKG